MHSSTSSYSQLIHKIDEFIRKYYLNKIVRGSIYLAAVLFASYILVTLTEYYGNFNPNVRTLLFYTFIGLNAFILIRWIIIPLSAYLRLGKLISYEQASFIIGQHFSNVKDKLINTLQLKKLADTNQQQTALIQASIDQKIAELTPIPFTSAIKLGENRRYLKYAIAPFIIILLIAFTAPSIFSESTERLLKHNKRFVKKAPFEFVILNKTNKAIQGEDYELEVKLTGNEIPQDVYLEDGANSFKLDKENIVKFRYTFKNLQTSKKIRLLAGEFSSDSYTIEIKRKPTLLNFDILVDYPEYTGRKNETFTNSGDLTVPVGSKLTWVLTAKNANSVELAYNKTIISLKPESNNLFKHSLRAMENLDYTLRPVNQEVVNHDSVAYQLKVIPDLSPAINVNERPDSTNNQLLYFVGQVSDDYGFTKMNFVYKVAGESDDKKQTIKAVSFDKNALQSNFFYSWNIAEMNAKPGEQIEYYFEVFDNDAVHGAKGTKTPLKTVNLPTEKEIENKIAASSQAVKQKMQQAIRQAGEIEKEAKKFNDDLLNKRSLTYEEKKKGEELLKKQKDLEDLIKEIQKINKQNLTDQQNFKEEREEILEKQKQIEDLFKNVLDEKTKEILKNLQQLLDQGNKNQTQKELSKMQVDNNSVKKELDRLLELYKQLEFDQKLEQNIDKLKELAKEQQELSKESQQKAEQKTDKATQEEQKANLQKEQEELKQKFEDIKKGLEELSEKNEELNSKNDFQNPEKEQEQIKQQQEQSSKNLEKNEMKKASENQQNASDQMQKMAEKMEEMQQKNESEQVQVNTKALREILKNLVTSSFDQEKVMQDMRNIRTNDPSYKTLTKDQRDIKDNMKMVEDSLYSLSKRVPQIQSVVNKEIKSINQNTDLALTQLADRRIAEASRNQQYAMTSINNLALMLSEVLNQMQNSMKNSQPGKGKKQSLSQLRQMQEKLNQNMQKAREQMQQQGKKPGEQGQGEQQGQGQGEKGQMSEQLAKMAREQQLIRQAMQEINREMNKDGQGSIGEMDKLTKEMEQTETDLVNKKIQQETLKRQQEILTKMLDAEKAERERELDDKRESKQGKDQSPNYNIVLEEYQKLKQRETELLKTLPPTLNSFYKNKVGDYFKLLNSGK